MKNAALMWIKYDYLKSSLIHIKARVNLRKQLINMFFNDLIECRWNNDILDWEYKNK